jgi:hypothetical protein
MSEALCRSMFIPEAVFRYCDSDICRYIAVPSHFRAESRNYHCLERVAIAFVSRCRSFPLMMRVVLSVKMIQEQGTR